MYYFNHFMSPRTSWKFQRFNQLVIMICLGVMGLLLTWMSLPDHARAGSPGTVKSSVKIASGLNGGPTLMNNGLFGGSATRIGDLNRDGVQDLAVGAYWDDTGGTDRGALYVLLMKADGTVSSSVKIGSGLNGGPTLADSDSFGVSANGIGDFNRDGVADLAVGAYADDTGGFNRGALYILLMKSDGTASSSVKIASGLNGGPTLLDEGLFGTSVSVIGDLNRDGVKDLAVGAYTDNTGGFRRGALYILMMNSDGTANSSVKIASGLNGGPSLTDHDVFGVSVNGIGDLNRDGVEDLAVGAYLDNTGGTDRGALYILLMKSDGTVNNSIKIASGLNGSPILADGDSFGTSVSKVGDLDRDGVEDLAVGAYLDDTGGTDRGAVYILLMRTNGTAHSSLKIAHNLNGGPTLANGDSFGESLNGIGDLNRDGLGDLAVSAFMDDTGGIDRGSLYILSLDGVVSSPNGAIDRTKIAHLTNGGPSLANSDLFGFSIGRIGDLNRDGVEDLAMGAYLDNTGGTDRGAIYISFMRSNGTVSSNVKIASGLNGGPSLNISDAFGIGVTGIGDLNRDGVEDLAVSALWDKTGGVNRGAVYILFMRTNGTVNSSVKIAHLINGGPVLNNDDQFGHSVNRIGDLNRDGIEDLAVGAYEDDTGGLDRGAVYILFMKADGTVGSNVKIAHQTNGGPALVNSDKFGTSVAGIGDLDRDGVEDLAVGAYFDNTGGPYRGAVYVLFMNPNGTVRSNVKIASGLNGGPILADGGIFGLSVSRIGDLNRDSVEDMVVGAYEDNTGGPTRGAAYVLMMNANGSVASHFKLAHLTRGGPALTDGDHFGSGAVGIGDLNRDGIEDLAVGADYDNTGGTDRGAVYILPLGFLPDLSLTKTVNPTTVNPGGTLTYTLTFSNSGGQVATGVVITDILPASVTAQSVISSGAVITRMPGLTYAWTVQNLAPGQGGVITIAAQVNPALTAGLTFTNTATIASASTDIDLLNNSAAASATVTPAPNECSPGGVWPVYGPAVNLIETLGNGSQVELAPAYSPGHFSLYSFLKEGDTYYLWFNNLQYSGSNYQSKEQRLESQDGLVWRNRTDTNLSLSSSFYERILGIREVIKNGNTYEGWEVYAPETVNGQWAGAVRYITSPDGLNWTVANQPIIETANVPSVIKEGSTYHMWAIPDIGDQALRYRTSNVGGTGWGHWNTGGTKVKLDGAEPNMISGVPRVRRLADGTYQLSYLTGHKLNLATSTDRINFTTVVTGLIDFDEKVPGLLGVGDVAVIEVGGEDWVYFIYRTNDQARHMAVTRSIKNCNNNLALSKTVTPTVAIPGQRITYTLTFTNEGPGIAQGVVVTDLVSVGQVSNLSYSAKGVVVTPTGSLSYTWQVSDLAAGQSGRIILTGIVSPNLSLGKSDEPPPGKPTLIINTASITSTGSEVDPSDNQDTVTTTITLPQVQFKALSYSVVENKGPAIITVTVAPPPLLTVTVRLTSADGTASHLSDYKAISQSLTFAPGVASLTTTLPISDDTLVEGAENFVLRLSQPARAALGLYTTATLTLLDNDLTSTPANRVYLPLVLNKVSGFPVFIGNAIPTRPANPVGETFYFRLVTIPQSLPVGGRFYFSSRPDQIAEIFVDDQLVVSLGEGGEIFSYQSILGQTNLVEVPRPVMQQIAGKSVLVEYRDMFGSVVSATDVWLIWIP